MNNQGMRLGNQMVQQGQMLQPGQMPPGVQQRATNFKELIFLSLRSQPVPSGWQTTFSLEERVGQVWQL